MDAHSTPHHLLLPIIYRELPVDQLDEIFALLKIDEKLRKEFQMLKEAKMKQPPLQLEPSQASIDRIMAYSRNV